MSEIYIKLLPLFLLIFIGAVGAKRLKLDPETLSKLVIYTQTPVIVLLGVWNAPDLGASLALVPLFFVLSTLFCLIFLGLGKYFFSRSENHFLAYALGICNSGFFGLPAALIFLGPQAFSAAVLISLGFTLYENTVGYYAAANGKFSAKEAFFKLLKLPSLYAFLVGLVLRFFSGVPSQTILESLQIFKGSYSVLGMMIIGIALTHLDLKTIQFKLWLSALGTKFLIWPLIGLGVVLIDRQWSHLFTELHHQGILLACALPLAGNTITFALHFKMESSRYALLVLVSTLVAAPFIYFWLPWAMTF